MRASEESAREFIIIEQLGTKMRQVVRFVPLVRVIIRLVIIISKFSLHQI